MKVLIAGDYCDRYRVSNAIQAKDFTKLFDGIKHIVENVDYSIVNFEFPIVLDESKPILKCGPNLKGNLLSIDAIKYAGFNCCTLANNHILDQGESCGINTKKLIENAGLDTVGFGVNEDEASTILYKTIKDITIAVINCCEHEFSVASTNTAGANGINPIKLYYSISEAKQKADFVLVIVHGGHEHFQLPSPRMVELYRFFIEIGADVVVNHHQHCFSGYEIFKDRPIFYGIGNFCFDDPTRQNGSWTEGYMVRLNLEKNKKIGYEIIPYIQCTEDVGVHLIKDTTKILKKIEQLSTIISNGKLLTNEVEKFYTSSVKYEIGNLEPYRGRILNKLHSLGLLPSTIVGKKLLSILNHIDCESHRDKLIFALKRKIN